MDGQTYIGQWEDLYRLNISDNGAGLEFIYSANYGQHRGPGVNNLMQCGDYLVFTQGSYIYKMHRETLEVTVLLSAENGNTCFIFDVKDDTIYFIGDDLDGDFTDAVYKINISGNQLSRLNTGEKPYAIKVYSDWIFYMTYSGIYRIKIGETEIENILSLRLMGTLPGMIISDGYIYYTEQLYSSKEIALYRIDINGENRIELAQLCYNFIIVGDWIYYSEVEVTKFSDHDSVHGKDIIRMRTDGTEREIIYVGYAELGGASGDWIYFTHATYDHECKAYRIGHYLISLDGMVIKVPQAIPEYFN